MDPKQLMNLYFKFLDLFVFLLFYLKLSNMLYDIFQLILNQYQILKNFSISLNLLLSG